jgi:hypothetical protein
MGRAPVRERGLFCDATEKTAGKLGFLRRLPAGRLAFPGEFGEQLNIVGDDSSALSAPAMGEGAGFRGDADAPNMLQGEAQ